jgi:transglutaminase-like putative cysteine protease
VSGYLIPLPGVVGAQASHAWVSVYVPESGWIDFDPTNDVVPAGGHITVGWGRDYADVSPLRGVMLGGGEHTLHVEVSVEAA